jgi:hypothetical protein
MMPDLLQRAMQFFFKLTEQSFVSRTIVKVSVKFPTRDQLEE